MGITPNNRLLELMRPEDRPKGRAGLTATEAHERMVRTLERQEQNTLVSWLSLREADGVLVYDWSRTDRKTTNRKGMPDFRIYRGPYALLGEMKIEDGRCSPDQIAMKEKFSRTGAQVQIWCSAADAIEKIRNWLTHGKG
jgi:hypothetical protein